MCCPESSTQRRRAILFMTVGNDSIVWLWALKEEKRVFFYDRQKPPWPGDPRQVRGRKLETQESRCSLHCTGGGDHFCVIHFLLYFYLFKNHYKFTNQYISLSLWGNNFNIIFPSFFLSLKSPPLNITLLFLLDFLRRDPKAHWKQDGTLLFLAKPMRHYGHLVAA